MSSNDSAGGISGNAHPSPPRSESMAYAAAHPANTLRAKAVHYVRYNGRKVGTAVAVALMFLFFLIDDEMGGGHASGAGGKLRFNRSGASDHWGGAAHPGYFSVSDSIVDDHTFRFAVVTDLDKLSLVPNSKKPVWRSTLLPGQLVRDDPSSEGGSPTYRVEFEEPRTLLSQHNEAGRGMELSELTVYKNRLLSFDDRTGTVFEILSTPDSKESYVVPRFVITEGDGDTDKGMKWEWATVKDRELVLGSMGKEYTRPDGSVQNTNNLWVAILNERGELRREDWEPRFNFVRDLLGAGPPGYIIMEAILWSAHLRKWVFLPRRISSEMYDEVKDETNGANKLVLVNENFTEGSVVEINLVKPDPLHGFSTFAFVPGTRDRHALAVRSVEEDCTGRDEDCKQRSYLMCFDVMSGEVLMDEVEITLAEKFEGIEFVDIYAGPPKA